MIFPKFINGAMATKGVTQVQCWNAVWESYIRVKSGEHIKYTLYKLNSNFNTFHKCQVNKGFMSIQLLPEF